MELTAYCGINCGTCPLYVATVNNNTSMKEDIRLKYEKIYNRSIDIKEMECNGCKSDKKFSLSRACNITPCNISKGIDTCSQCRSFKCDRIKKFYDWQEKNETQVEIITNS